MGTLNYTTTIPATRTVGECQALLAKHGASRVAVEYLDGSPAGLAFWLPTPHGDRSFILPVDVAAVQRLLTRQENDGEFRASRKRAGHFSSREHAERVAWRVVKDWLEAQLAMIEAQMATLDQVMLPYLNVDRGKTLYAVYQEREHALALPG